MADLVLALDLSGHTGWAIGRIGDETPQFGTFVLPKTGDAVGPYLIAFERWLDARMKFWRPDRVFFEAPILSQRNMTARKLMGLANETEKACEHAQVPVREVSLSSIKLFFAGHGKAEKSHMVQSAHRRGWPVTDDNQADACGLWLYGSATVDPALESLAAPRMKIEAKPKPAASTPAPRRRIQKKPATKR